MKSAKEARSAASFDHQTHTPVDIVNIIVDAHTVQYQRRKGKVIRLPTIQNVKSAEFVLWGMLSGLLGVALTAIVFYSFEDSSNAYGASRRAEGNLVGLLIFAMIFVLLGAVLQIIGIYRAFRTFDAIGAKYIFGSYSEHPYAWGPSVSPYSEVNSPIGTTPESHPLYGVNPENIPNPGATSSERGRQFEPGATN